MESDATDGSGKPVQAPLLGIGTEGGEPFVVDTNAVVTGRTCVIGASGSGKSYAVGVICEELCKNGVPFALVDTEGEYSGLKEKYEVVWVADDERADLKWGNFGRKELAAQALDVPPLILDVSETKESNQRIGALLSALYVEVESRRVPYLIIVEEADKFVPQVGERLPIFDEIARRGRKRGLGLMICTQRPSVVDKNILSQCGNQLIGKLVIRNDLEAVSQFFPQRSLPKQLTNLEPGDFYALGGLSPTPRCIRIRNRETPPGGVTPQFVPREIRPLRMLQGSFAAVSTPMKEAAVASEEATTTSSKEPQGPAPIPSDRAPGQDTLLGIAFAITPDEVPGRIRRLRSFGIFGQREVMGEVQPVHRRLLELGIGLKTGVLTKRYETKYVILDAATGKIAELGKKLVLQDGLERLLGLEARGVEVLRSLSEDRYSSVVDVNDRMKISSDTARKVLNELERRRLVKSSMMGRVRVYQRTTNIPDLDLKESPLSLSEVDSGNRTPQQNGPTEAQLREVVKGLRADYDLVSLRPFLYPFYRVELALGNKNRTVWIDGVTGEETQV